MTYVKFSFWRARPQVKRNIIGSPSTMEKLIKISNKGMRARIESMVKSYARSSGMENHIGKHFFLEGDHVRFKCSDEFGTALKRTFPKLNLVKDPDAKIPDPQKSQTGSSEPDVPILPTEIGCAGACAV